MTLLYQAATAFSVVVFLFYGTACLFSDGMKADFERFGLSRVRLLIGVLEVLGAVGLWSARDSSPVETEPRVATAVAGNVQLGAEQARGGVESRTVQAPTQLALGGDMSQLEDDQLLTLLEEVSALEAMPGEEPASLAIEPVLPVDQEDL